MATAHTRASRRTVRSAVASLPSQLSSGIGTPVQSALQQAAEVLLGHMRDAFIVKSAGGTDEAGDRWAPLLPATVRAKARRSRSATPKPPPRQRYAVKGRGPAQPFDKYAAGHRANLILRDSDRLLESLTPGSGSSDQVVSVVRGGVMVGTNRPGAMTHHYGSPKRGIPQRRLWPPPGNWPPHWWQVVTSGVQRAAVQTITDEMRTL